MRLCLIILFCSFIFTYNVSSPSLPEGKAPDGYENTNVREGLEELEERRREEERARQAAARRQLLSQEEVNRLAEAAEEGDNEALSDSEEENDIFFAAFNRARGQRLAGERG